MRNESRVAGVLLGKADLKEDFNGLSSVDTERLEIATVCNKRWEVRPVLGLTVEVEIKDRDGTTEFIELLL